LALKLANNAYVMETREDTNSPEALCRRLAFAIQLVLMRAS
jgi:hypothetical protein